MSIVTISHVMIFVITYCVSLNNKKTILRIVGGRNATESEYNYVVRIEMHITNRMASTVKVFMLHHCTGAALTEEWTLTAGHCVTDIENLLQNKETNEIVPGLMSKVALIRYGSVLSLPTESKSFSIIIAAVKHPSFLKIMSTKGIVRIYNDVGLLKNNPIMLKEYGKLSPLDYMTLVGQPAIVVGYGITQFKSIIQDSLSLGLPLQVMSVLIKKCYEQNIAYPALCLASVCNNSGVICPGDSGGPTLHATGVIGVNSLGMVSDCFIFDSKKRSKWTGTITPISTYITWIKSLIN